MRTETIGDATLYCGDCREVMPPVDLADAIITDPPYGQSFKSHAARLVGKGLNGSSYGSSLKRMGARHAPKVIGDEVDFDPSFLTESGVPSIIWGAHKFFHKLPARGSWLVWDKREGRGSNNYGDGEAAWIDMDQPLRIFHYLWNGLVIKSGAPEGQRDFGTGAPPPRMHPTQKPVELMRWCLGFINAQRIIDPFMGAGSTGVACMNEGRKFVGIEIDPVFFDVSCRRIEDAQRHKDLFIHTPAEDPADTRIADLFREPDE